MDWSTTQPSRLIVTETAELKPNARKCTAQGAAWERSVDRGMFYVSADKVGTKFSSGNYLPWVDYFSEARWIKGLWRKQKLTHGKALEYGFKSRLG